jgi:DNA polymerase III alpha subunit
MSTNFRRTDAWGRVILNEQYACELALEGVDIWSMVFDPNSRLDRYNEFCSVYNKTEFEIAYPEELTISPEEEHARRSNTWMVPDEVKDIDVRAFLLSMCETDEELDRVNNEMDLFEARNLIPVLQLMIHLIDTFRQKGIVWGVGRGSSVASYCLYLIGVHKINSLRYGLEISEFLR